MRATLAYLLGLETKSERGESSVGVRNGAPPLIVIDKGYGVLWH
jgi:hypothetical protein